MGLCYDTTKWADSIWSRHASKSYQARSIVTEGTNRRDEFGGFAEDIHARLYLRNSPNAIEGEEPQWARELHKSLDELAEWRTLRARTQGDGFSSGLATEQLLQALLPHITKQEKKQDNGKGKGKGKPQKGDGQGQGQGQGTGMSGEKMRQVLRQAVAQAKQEVDNAQASLEGLEDACGFSRAGTGIEKPETLADLENVHNAYNAVRGNPHLKRIAELAGRLSRLAATKKRTKVKPATGGIKGVTVGGTIDKVLPQELAPLCSSNPLAKLAALDKILKRRALSYLQEGEEPQKRGPIVVLTDESGSMQGEREVWSKAVALALLTTAAKQKRAWHLAGFQFNVTHQHTIEAGDSNAMAEIGKAIAARCAGGTGFDSPFNTACDKIEKSETMKRADIIVITDGDASISQATIDRVNKLRKEHGVSVFVIGIECVAYALNPVADKSVVVWPHNGNELVSDFLSLE